jgi:hypothetical protein
MRFKVEFRYRPKGYGRPRDDVQEVDVQGDEKAFFAIPNVGDHVAIGDDFAQNRPLIVESRLFSFVGSGAGPICAINIVLTDSKIDPERFLKL